MIKGDIGGRQRWVAFGVVILLFAALAIVFGRLQNVWIDESTQLSGMTLSPLPLLQWLAGRYDPAFGVPGDRMPPVSYLVDHVAWSVFGYNLLALRLVHAAIAGAGIVTLMAAVAKRFTGRAALLTGLLLAVSPRVIDLSVELRAYPIFFALTCVQVAMLLRGGIAADGRRLLGFLLLSLLAGYTHFFGVIASCAFFFAILIDAPSWRTAIRAVIGFAIVLACYSGLAPLVMGATTISNHEPQLGPGVNQIVVFFFQLLGHSALMVDPTVAGVYFLGVALLGLPALVGFALRVSNEKIEARHDPAVSLVVALVAGLAVCILASFVIHGFNTISPKYNIWTLPPLAVLLAISADGLLRGSGKIWRVMQIAGLALFAIGCVWGQVAFLSRADWFIHGPSRTLEAMVDKAGPNSAVVYTPSAWGWGYFPLYWHHRDALPQYLVSNDGTQVIRIGMGGDPNGPSQPASVLRAYRALVVGRIESMTYMDLRRRAQQGSLTDLDFSNELVPSLSSNGWTLDETVTRPGLYDFKGQIYTRASTAPAP